MQRIEVIGVNNAPLFREVLEACGIPMDPKSLEPSDDSAVSGTNPYMKPVLMAEWKVRAQAERCSECERPVVGFHALGIIRGKEVPTPTTREALRTSYRAARGRSMEYRVGIAVVRVDRHGNVSGYNSRCCAQSLSVMDIPDEEIDFLVASVPESAIGRSGLGHRPFTDRYASRLIDDLDTEKRIFRSLMEATIRAMNLVS